MFNYIIINKDNLINNIKQVKTNNPKSKICAMVKANAYGVGQTEVVEILDKYVDYFGVACFFEAVSVSKLTNKKILIVGALEKENVDEQFSYACHSLEDVEFLINTGKTICVHLKVNTGMNRYGFCTIKEFKTALRKIKKSNLILEGVFTHFATGDNYVDKQMDEFNEYLKILKRRKLKPLIHADNSFVQENLNHNLDMVRVGFCLYNQNDRKYKSVVEIKTQVVQINKVKKDDLVGYDYRCVANKKMKVAVLPVGYADGIDLRLIGFKLNINGEKCKILNICMDCCMVDVSDVKIKKEDYVYLLNKDNPLKNYANYLNVSEYQVMCNFSKMRAVRLVSTSDCEDEQH